MGGKPASMRSAKVETKTVARKSSESTAIVKRGLARQVPNALDDPRVDALLSQPKWHDERKALRAILLDCDLAEEVKWGKLCYTFAHSNVAMIYGLKSSSALGFFKGALLKDAQGVLDRPGENSQSMRWIKFTSVRQISEMQAVLKDYVRAAIAVEEAGLKVDSRGKAELVLPQELQTAMASNAALKAAFAALTPGRQRGYNLYFCAAKQSSTRVARIEKCVPRILNGKGLQDR